MGKFQFCDSPRTGERADGHGTRRTRRARPARSSLQRLSPCTWLASDLMTLSGMTFARQALGKSGEDLAVQVLEREGYAVIERRYRTRHGEIDIIARDGEAIVFVEVRRRRADACGTAAESVTRPKQLKVIRMAIDYLARAGLWDKCLVRFDVVAIDDQPEGPPRVQLFKAAFDAST